MTFLSGSDLNADSRRREQKRLQAEWLKQQIYEKEMKRLHEETSSPANTFTDRMLDENRKRLLGRTSIQERYNLINKELASMRDSDAKPSDAVATSLSSTVAHSLQTDFKGLDKDIVRRILLEENASQLKLKEQEMKKEMEADKRFAQQVEYDRVDEMLKCITLDREKRLQYEKIAQERRINAELVKVTNDALRLKDEARETGQFFERSGKSLI